MTSRASDRVRLEAVLAKYRSHPDFLGIDLSGPNQRGAVDDTVLHIATRQGAVEDIEVLVNSGARVDEAGDLGFTALHMAAMSGQTDTVKVLLRLGASPTVQNEFGQTPFEVAELGGHAEAARLLDRRPKGRT